MAANQRFILCLLIAFGILSFTACKKEEGEGGRSSISGVVIAQDMVSPLNPVVANEFPIAEERVYIVYGDQSEVYDDDMRTDYQGRYHFRYLREGTYTIFTYTDCNVIQDTNCSASGGEYPVIRSIQLGKNEDLVVEDIVIQKYD